MTTSLDSFEETNLLQYPYFGYAIHPYLAGAGPNCFYRARLQQRQSCRFHFHYRNSGTVSMGGSKAICREMDIGKPLPFYVMTARNSVYKNITSPFACEGSFRIR